MEKPTNKKDTKFKVKSKENITEDCGDAFTPIKAQIDVKNSRKRKNVKGNDVTEKKLNDLTLLNESSDITNDIYDEITQLPSNVIEQSKQLAQDLILETNRKRKKCKHKKLLAEKLNSCINREVQRNEEYLKLWKNSREKWKFEKLRQISIEQTMLDQLNGELWPIALEYLAGSKGAAKERILARANDVIDRIDKEYEKLPENELNKTSLIKNITYQRARDLLQTFN